MINGIAGLLVAALLAGLIGLAYTTGRKHEANAWRTEIARMKADHAQAEADARAAKEAHEAADREAIAARQAQHDKELADAKAARGKLGDDLRTGAVRLRDSLTCPPPADLPGPPAGTGREDEAAELRAADARAAVAAAIELADQCDADIRWGQGVIATDRGEAVR